MSEEIKSMHSQVEAFKRSVDKTAQRRRDTRARFRDLLTEAEWRELQDRIAAPREFGTSGPDTRH